MDQTAPRPLWVTIAMMVRTGLTTAALVLLIGFGTLSVIGTPSSNDGDLGLSARPLNHLMTRNRCSYTGFDASTIPSRAIVRDGAGRTRLVSFQRGWDVFTGKRRGQLVAVCLGPKPRSLRS